MTYYQKKRVIAKLERIQNRIKYNERENDAAVTGMRMIDEVIRLHLAEPCTVGRGKPLPRRF